MVEIRIRSVSEGEAAIRRLDLDLIEGRITEAEYRRRKAEIERQMELIRLDEDLIEGRITEAEYRRRKAEIEGAAGPAARPGTQPFQPQPQPQPRPQPPPQAGAVERARSLARELSEVRAKREKLAALLKDGKIGERTHHKIDLELAERESKLKEDLSKLTGELRERLRQVEGELEDLRLQREEALARHEIGEMPDQEYRRAISEIESREARLSEERESLEAALAETGGAAGATGS